MLSVTLPGQKEPTTGFAPVSSDLRGRRLSYSSHVGVSRSARIRTLCHGFGGRLLSQEHAPIGQGSGIRSQGSGVSGSQ
jgi:hypothetical protein